MVKKHQKRHNQNQIFNQHFLNDNDEQSDNSTSSTNSRPMCEYCAKYGHIIDECFALRCGRCNKTGHFTNKCEIDEEELYCFYCKDYGHIIINCYNATCKKCNKKGHSDRWCDKKRCEKCHLKTHTTNECFTKPCDTCNELGHFTQKCRNNDTKNKTKIINDERNVETVNLLDFLVVKVEQSKNGRKKNRNGNKKQQVQIYE